MTVRDYSSGALNDLEERSRYYADKAEYDMVEWDHLLDALAYYRQRYEEVLEEAEKLAKAVRGTRHHAVSIVETLNELPE